MWTKVKSSLTLKSAIVVIFAILLGTLSFLTLNFIGEAVVKKSYTNYKATEQKLEDLELNLKNTVNPNGKSCDSISEIHNWLNNKPGIFISLFSADSGQLVYESDGTFDTTYHEGEAKTYIQEDANSFIIIYKDVELRAVLKDNSYQEYYVIVIIISMLAGFAVALFLMLFSLSHRYKKRILILSKQVKAVSYGETDREIGINGSDEITELGEEIDNMRISIVEHYEKEQNAIKANKELLTSISHDIRTPLTSIIGYSEMMVDERTTDTEELKNYAEICKNKAYRLKELTDTLFRYFYVYGKEENDLHFEKYDAEIFFYQIMGEPISALRMDGYEIVVPSMVQGTEKICIDVDLFGRILDNVFSNLRKYADKSEKITMAGYISKGKVYITIENKIRSDARKAESTKVGLKTCARAMHQLGGDFEIKDNGKVFKEILSLPLL